MGDSRMDKTKIVLITDAWEPQVNGVVTTYKNIIENLAPGITVDVIHPGLFHSVKLPFYKEIAIPFCSYDKMYKIIEERDEHWHKLGHDTKYHIATEGILGYQAKRVLDKIGIKYTTSYHTKFPEFLNEIYGIPVSWTKWYFDWFHKNAKYVMCSSKSNAEENSNWNSVVLSKGYDAHFTFNEKYKDNKVILLYVGRVSREKNIDEFCELDVSGCVEPSTEVIKVVVGDGPYKNKLQKKYPNVKFLGYRFGEQLAQCYQSADVLVFPSKVDTYGIVILESMACGTPVAAFPVTGPIDQIQNGLNGCVDEDLSTAVCFALGIDRGSTHMSVKGINWKKSADQFAKYIIEK
jgi:glycosyltransferase involved in cell wall biosynthesis